MKNQTTNTNKIAENTNTRNFFQKTFILLAILAFSSFGFKATAQTSANLDIVNNSGCDYNVRAYNGSTLLGTVTVIAGQSSSTNCITGNVTKIEVEDVNSSCAIMTFLKSGLIFPYTSITPTGCTCPTSAVDCIGSAGILCTSPNMAIIIQMF